MTPPPAPRVVQDDRLTELYRTYGPVIYARCVRLLGEPVAAEDATQETFLRVHRHLATAPSASEALLWIYRIATNYCLNEVRNRKRRPDLLRELPELPTGDSEDLLADRDFAARLVAEAPENLRVVAWLHHVDGMDQGAIAELEGISRRTVVTRIADFAAYAARFAKRSQ